MKKNNLLNSRRYKILNLSRDVISKYGWNDLTFKKISKEKKINISEINLLFPNGFKDMIKYSLNCLNYDLEKKINKIDIQNIPLHRKIKKIVLTKIEIMNNHKNFYKKTFYYLMIPTNYKLLTSQLYISIDLMWRLADDTSTDFNYYTKRIILSGVYSSVIISFLKKDNMIEIENILDNRLSKVSKIPILKNKYKNFITNFKKISKLINISPLKQ
tara:strand:- start:232 stop:876 length:645 start_codon:yes stop_codon:yes gene_type:complete